MYTVFALLLFLSISLFPEGQGYRGKKTEVSVVNIISFPPPASFGVKLPFCLFALLHICTASYIPIHANSQAEQQQLDTRKFSALAAEFTVCLGQSMAFLYP